MKNQDFVEKVETYTYSNSDVRKQTLEVLLIGVSSQDVGSSNTFEPPGFNKPHLTTWMRKNYFFLSGTVFPQIPRRFQNYPDEARSVFPDVDDLFATDIMCSDRNVFVYYPDTDNSAICVSWDTKYDTWSMSRVTQPIDQGNIVQQEGDAKGKQFVWSTNI